MSSKEELRAQILALVGEYHRAAWPERSFEPGQTVIPPSGKVFDEQELQLLVDASLDFWLTTGRYARQFEAEFAKVFDLRYALLVNSGSSANLVALTALTSPRLGDSWSALVLRARSRRPCGLCGMYSGFPHIMW